MNIKQHIEAGHYEKMSDHVYVLRTRDGEKAFIYTTRHHPEWEIVGGIDGEQEAFCWQADGKIRGDKTDDRWDLMPPPARKVKVTARLQSISNMSPDYVVQSMRRVDNGQYVQEGISVELTGEYEESWA